MSRRMNELQTKRQRKFGGSKRTCVRFKYSYRQKKLCDNKDVTCYEWKELAHYKNEYPKLKKEKPNKKAFTRKKKGLMAIWDDSDSLEYDSEEEQANVALMESIKAFDEKIQSDLE